jgi:hypothetical protein
MGATHQHLLELPSRLLVPEWFRKQVSGKLEHRVMLPSRPIVLSVQCRILGRRKLELNHPPRDWPNSPACGLVRHQL